MKRLAIALEGTVQGVGFRPFVYRAAVERGLTGFVRNGTAGVEIEVQGEAGAVDDFVTALRTGPDHARIAATRTGALAPRDERGFAIAESTATGRACIPPDLATCNDCLAEVRDRASRRHGYAFTTCTRCGPRFTIATSLPYDRARTTMARFPLCTDCAREYGDARDRRFHAEPIACPRCGPRPSALRGGRAQDGDPIALAVAALGAGEIVALQGIGGFQLLADAMSDAALARLRERKRRPEKPLAVLVASIEAARELAFISEAEERTLASSAAPIVLVRGRGRLSPLVAPRLARLGLMLPASPLHHLIARGPLVCTSGNVSGEPLAIEPTDALERLGAIADLFLVHDRPIARPADDSVVRLDGDTTRVLRRARGFAPSPITIEDGPTVLALGPHQKSTIALAIGGQAILSQHLGDLGSARAVELHERTARELLAFHGARPDAIACDLHPDYASTRLAERLARELGVPLVRVQHHHAHVAAALAELAIDEPVLGIAWDGTGAGPDGTIWGGEALLVDGARFERFAHLRPFRLPGGERAAREPRRSAAGLLHELGLPIEGFPDHERPIIETMLARGVNAPVTTSMGRLFDAIAFLIGGGARVSYEGQAAIELETLADAERPDGYPLPLMMGAPCVADWGPLVRALLEDRAAGAPASRLSARFHEALASLVVEIAGRAGRERVVLTGGCFQNARLLARSITRLEAAGFTPLVARDVPLNDGGIALGQAWVARKEVGRVSRRPR
jgi:hydrogenase maturation protein HypF